MKTKTLNDKFWAIMDRSTQGVLYIEPTRDAARHFVKVAVNNQNLYVKPVTLNPLNHNAKKVA